jgi:hypothetical protein
MKSILQCSTASWTLENKRHAWFQLLLNYIIGFFVREDKWKRNIEKQKSLLLICSNKIWDMWDYQNFLPCWFLLFFVFVFFLFHCYGWYLNFYFLLHADLKTGIMYLFWFHGRTFCSSSLDDKHTRMLYFLLVKNKPSIQKSKLVGLLLLHVKFIS